jgi:multidrug/hemolysin transport system permease protein
MYYRNKTSVFFSMLAVLILIALHFIVFREMFTDNWVEIISSIPGLSVPRLDLAWLTDSIMFAALLPIAAVTISLTTLGRIVSDKEDGVFADFMTAPISRTTLLASYLISSFILGAIMLLGFLAAFEIYFVAMYSISFSLAQVLRIIAIVLGSLVFANVMMLLLISFFKSQQSLSAVGTIVGTLIGFVSGAYIMVGMFGDTLRNVFGMLPFLQLTVLSRQAFLARLEEVTPLTHEFLSGELARDFGIELWLGDTNMATGPLVALVAAMTLVLFVILIFVFPRLNRTE